MSEDNIVKIKDCMPAIDQQHHLQLFLVEAIQIYLALFATEALLKNSVGVTFTYS